MPRELSSAIYRRHSAIFYQNYNDGNELINEEDLECLEQYWSKKSQKSNQKKNTMEEKKILVLLFKIIVLK